MKKTIKYIFAGISIMVTNFSIFVPIILSSSSNALYFSNIDKNLKSIFFDWYNSLSNSDWNKDENGEFIDYKSFSEQQSLCLYANFRGYYWNEDLHSNKEPIDQIVRLKLAGEDKPLRVYGKDYLYIVEALSRAIWPYDYITYHGVEYMENEFYDQLKEYITGNEKDGYDYSQCVGKTITSYGLLSTSISRDEAIKYCDGWNWENNEINLPLKEKFVFEIKIPKGITGVAYLADFPLSGVINQDNQILFSINSKMLITNWYKENDINFFKIDLISVN